MSVTVKFYKPNEDQHSLIIIVKQALFFSDNKDTDNQFFSGTRMHRIADSVVRWTEQCPGNRCEIIIDPSPGQDAHYWICNSEFNFIRYMDHHGIYVRIV